VSRPSTLRGALRQLRPFVQRFAPFLREERKLLIGGVLALFLEVGMRLLTPWPLKFVIDSFTGHGALPGSPGDAPPPQAP